MDIVDELHQTAGNLINGVIEDGEVPVSMLSEAADEIERLRKALSAAGGYLMNAKIDLETGAPKRTAVRTIEGGLKMVNEALATPSPIGSEQP